MTMIDADLLKPYLTEADNARQAWRTAVAALSKSHKDALEEGFRAVKVAERSYYRCCEELANALRSTVEGAEGSS
ncbi:hypothetical protein HX870_07035 [Pseudomonas gingeri]|uniref:Uncharacterized protein n=2 Tax=Pseudomonas gingeri TaxID=117681 RepID=A0A7Y8C587_9PSED|nr:hypothetical protein [Pseudomonas gingeri]NWA25831.1 hypothetical protein [Pseudomonas gingeri]NWB99136.1 hypothetical protein [Pseudomonas gingeri]NWD67352.1 hypothetical protein [Pseudomonas gingeri]NWD75770.1 hypothetical protein [Pseudomonas gingeri]